MRSSLEKVIKNYSENYEINEKDFISLELAKKY